MATLDWRRPPVGSVPVAVVALGGLAIGMVEWMAGGTLLARSGWPPLSFGLLAPLFFVAFGGAVIVLIVRRRRQLDERAMLLRVGRAAASSLELRTVLAEIARASLGIAGTECCTILLWHPDEHEFEIGADQTIPAWPGTEEPGTRYPDHAYESDLLAMAEGKAHRLDLNSPELPENSRQHMRLHGTESVLSVPLVAGETALGTLNLLSRKRGVFDARALRLGEEIAAQTALAILHARLLDETRRHAAESRILLQVSRAATSSLELHSVLAEIAEAGLGIPSVECCAIMLWHPDQDQLEMGIEVTAPDWPGVDPPGTRYDLDEVDTYRRIVTSREPILFEDDDPTLADLHRQDMIEWGARTVLLFPLWVADECLGLLQLYSRQPHAFGPAAIRLTQDVAGQTALAINNARLLDAARRHADEQTALLRVSRAVSSSLRLGDVLSEVARASLGVAGAEACEIELWHPETDDTELVAQHHVADWLNHKNNVGARFPLADWPLSRRVLLMREPMIIAQDGAGLTEYEREILFNDDSRSGFAVPIVVDNRCLGILSLYSRRPDAFNARAVTLGQDLANQAALAIERARLHTALEERARTDGLTGVLNRGAIQDLLDDEIARARRAGLSLAVILVDLDGFKGVNDCHGHLAGDRVLREVTRILGRAVREGDAVGRYGGDEFLAILPGADAVGAAIVADRISRVTAAIRIAVDETSESLPIRMSLGQAVYPVDGSDADELLDAADRSMYAAKHNTALVTV